ncbi:deazapurine DNA modification protein DpdA family protein [Streptomyces sp. NPDC002547]
MPRERAEPDPPTAVLFDLPDRSAGHAEAARRPRARITRRDPGRPRLDDYDDIERDSYLGTHHPSWLARPEFGGSRCIPLCISHRRLAGRRTLPRAVTHWLLDSGAYSELYLRGEWTVSTADYAAAVRRYHEEIGNLEHASIQDWMCEPHILKRTGQSVYDHQARTVASYINLMWRDDTLPWMPVLQGWTLDEYLRHVEMYDAMGIDLTLEPRVGLGSICRRQSTREAIRIVETLHGLGIRLHGFGFKVTGLRSVHHLLYSSDSLAWSFSARHDDPMPGCSHKACSNCPVYALAWRNRMLRSLPLWQQIGLHTAF